jgi:hypothetical protein
MKRAALCLLLVAWAPRLATAQDLRAQLGSAWQFHEVGNLQKAQDTFAAVLSTDEGRRNAEAWYGIAVVWWDRGNALAALQRLREASLQAQQPGWDPAGDFGERIASRATWLERNLAAVNLRADPRRPFLGPQADPAPKDPALKKVIDAAPALLAESHQEGGRTRAVLLPGGDYWVGGEKRTLVPGAVDPTAAPFWDLPVATSSARADWEGRQAALDAGEVVTVPVRAEPAGNAHAFSIFAGGGIGVGLAPNGTPPASVSPLGQGGVSLFGGSVAGAEIATSFSTVSSPSCAGSERAGYAVAAEVGPRLRSAGMAAFTAGLAAVGGGGGIMVSGAARDACGAAIRSGAGPAPEKPTLSEAGGDGRFVLLGARIDAGLSIATPAGPRISLLGDLRVLGMTFFAGSSPRFGLVDGVPVQIDDAGPFAGPRLRVGLTVRIGS